MKTLKIPILFVALALLSSVSAVAQPFVTRYENMHVLLVNGMKPTLEGVTMIEGLEDRYDGLGGIFIWSAGSSAATNSDKSIVQIPGVDPGRWIRLQQEQDVGGGGGGTSLTNGVASRAVGTDANTNLVTLAVTTAELAHVSGVTGPIQTQFGTKAALASPTFTGNPLAPTPSAADNDTSIATTAFVQGELAAKAPLASPTFTGTPTIPTLAGALAQPPLNISASAIDWTLGNVRSKSLSANTTFTWSGAVSGQRLMVIVTNGASWTLTWPTVTWLSGSAPVMDTGAGVVNVFSFYYDGAVYYGDLSQQANATLARFAGIGAGVSGDIIYRDATGWTNLAKGSDTQVLKLASGLPSWASALPTTGLTTDPGAQIVVKPDGSLIWCSPRNYVRLEDEFNMGANTASTSDLGWLKANASGGAGGSWGSISAQAPIMGAMYIGAGTAAGGYTSIGLNVNSTFFGQGEVFYETRLELESSLSNGTDTYQVIAGWADNTTSTNVTDGVYFLYLDTINEGKWTACTANNGSVTTNTVWAGTTAAQTWYRLGININAAGTAAVFYVDGTPIATNTTNIPTTYTRGTAPHYHTYKHAGATTKYTLIDYFRCYQWLTSTR